MTARRPVNKDGDFYRRVIHRSHQRFLEDLDPVSILDLFLETEYIPYTEVRDIQETRLSSDRTRAILKSVSSKGVKGYKKFRGLLLKSQQGHLAEYLDEQEADLENQIKMAERNPQTPSQNSAPVAQETDYQRIPDDKELLSIAAHIGINWEMLGPFLGIPTTTIDQIKLDNSTTILKIYRMLFLWRAMNARDATLEKLLSQMEKAPRAVNIDWDALREDAKRYGSDNRNMRPEQTVQNLGARPKTRPSSQNIKNQGAGEQKVTDDFVKMALGEKGSKDDLQETPAGNPGQKMDLDQRADIYLNQLPGEFGNTRRNDPDVSNAYEPDMSRNTYQGTVIDGRTRPDYADETDASRERSIEGPSPQAPNPKSLTEPINRQSGQSDPTVQQSLHSIDKKLDLLVQNKDKTAEPREQAALTHSTASTVTPEQLPNQTPSQLPQTSADDVDGIREKEKQRLIKDREIERDKRLKNLFSSENDVQGRLKELDSEQDVADLMDCCGTGIHGSGGFGDIYVSKKKIPGLNMQIVIKKVLLTKETDGLKMRSITNEKLASRTMHFAIVPLLALREDKRNMIYYFISPYFENGDVFEAIKADNERLRQGEPAVLDRQDRLRILFHVASAIDFLHKPVPGYRETVLHMDIKTLNIVLDKYYNARLIDFGLAREMREGEQKIYTTTRELAHTEGYFRTMKGQTLTKHADYYNFGVVIRELLTGLPFFVQGQSEDEELRNQNDLFIFTYLMEMWMNEKDPVPMAEELVELSVDCIEDAEMKTVNSHYILSKVTGIMTSACETRWMKRNTSLDEDKARCEMCLVYPAVKDKILAHGCGCWCKLDVCVTCMRNSYLNPIRCHSCDIEMKPIIGHDWGAILIAGNDADKKTAESFKEDVAAIKTVITSKWPLVMGISKSMVKTVWPKNPGVDENLKDSLKTAVSSLNKKEDIQTILIYYSGHYYPKEIEGRNGKGFKLGGEKEYLTLEELQSMLAPFLKSSKASTNTVLTYRRFIVFLDCCKAPSLLSSPIDGLQKVENEGKASAAHIVGQSGDPKAKSDSGTASNKPVPFLTFEDVDNYSIVQINACRHNQKSKGSIFRKLLTQALTRKALKKQCVINTALGNQELGQHVEECKDTECRLHGDFVTMQGLEDYITKHLEKFSSCSSQPVIHAHNVSSHDAKIGYVVNFSADLKFTYMFNKTKRYGNVAKEMVRDVADITEEMFSEMLPLKTVLYGNFFKEMVKAGEIKPPIPEQPDFVDILCIEVEKGPKKQHKEELDTLEKITGAWNSKRELVVSLREISQIRRGKVGVFLTEGFQLSTILETSPHTEKSNDSSGISFLLKGENLRPFHRKLEKNNFKSHMTDVISAIDIAKKLYKLVVTELQIILPVKSDGQSLLRDDFVCFQVKFQERH